MSEAWPDISLWGIYTSIPTWTQNLLKAAEAASLNISSHRTSLKWSQRMSQSAQGSHKLFNKMGHLVVNLMESQWKLRHNMIRSSQWRQSHCRTNTSIRRKKKIQKSRTMIITVCDLFLFYFCNYFCLTKLHLRCCIGLELNILTWSTKVLKGIGGNPYDLEKIWKIRPPACPKNTFPKVFHPLSFLHLISNGLNGVNINSLT